MAAPTYDDSEFVVLMDVRNSPPPSAAQRKAVADRVQAMYRVHPARLAGMALLMASAIQRGVLTAIQWLSKSSFPTRAFANVSEAEAWLRAQLRAGS